MSNVIPFSKPIVMQVQAHQLDEASQFLIEEWRASYGSPLGIQQRAKVCASLEKQVREKPDNVFVAIDRSEVVGIALTSSNCVDLVFVSKRHRRRGVGTLLVRYCLLALSRKGFKFAQAGCETDNEEFAELLTKLEFEAIGVGQGVHVYSRAIALGGLAQKPA